MYCLGYCRRSALVLIQSIKHLTTFLCAWLLRSFSCSLAPFVFAPGIKVQKEYSMIL